MTIEDFETNPVGTFKTLDEKDIQIAGLRAALEEIAENGHHRISPDVKHIALTALKGN